MAERREHLGFTFEPRKPIDIELELLRQHLECDVAIQLRVAGPVDLTHAAGAERGSDFVWTEASSSSKGHPRVLCGERGSL